MAPKPITVSQLNHYINRVLGTDSLLTDVLVVGEVSGYKVHASGHIYFTLKDQGSKMNCFFPFQLARSAEFLPEDGMEIWVKGQIRVYEAGGYYSLHVREITASGEGGFAVAFQRLKEKLEKENLFSPEHKKKIPSFPQEVAVITSETGAALKDILSILTSRNPGLTIRIFPSLVQGEQAPKQLIRQLDRVQELFPSTDVILLGRGGGSLEDLWAFNNEELARAIYQCSIPVISAVGHETDFTIADFVADARAETPTAAAVMAAPNIGEWKERICHLEKELYENIIRCIDGKSLIIKGYQWEHLHRLLQQRIQDQQEGLASIRSQMARDLNNRVIQKEMRMESLWASVEDLDPFRVMERGYGIILNQEGKAVKSAFALKPAENITILMKDGEASADVISIKEKDHGRRKTNI